MTRLAARPKAGEDLAPFLDRLRSLPFVRAAETIEQQEPAFDSRRFDATVRIETEAGAYEYLTEVKRSYLDEAVTRAVAAAAKDIGRRKRRMLLFARYIPRPTAQRLIDAGVEFADLAGNIHLDLAPHYHWTAVGSREKQGEGRKPVETPAGLQLLFTIAAHPESAEWTVRELAGRRSLLCPARLCLLSSERTSRRSIASLRTGVHSITSGTNEDSVKHRITSTFYT